MLIYNWPPHFTGGQGLGEWHRGVFCSPRKALAGSGPHTWSSGLCGPCVYPLKSSLQAGAWGVGWRPGPCSKLTASTLWNMTTIAGRHREPGEERDFEQAYFFEKVGGRVGGPCKPGTTHLWCTPGKGGHASSGAGPPYALPLLTEGAHAGAHVGHPMSRCMRSLFDGACLPFLKCCPAFATVFHRWRMRRTQGQTRGPRQLAPVGLGLSAVWYGYVQLSEATQEDIGVLLCGWSVFFGEG